MILNRTNRPEQPFEVHGALRSAMRAIANNLRTLRTKLFFTYVVVGLLPMLIFGGIIRDTVEQHFIERRVWQLRSGATDTAIELANWRYMHVDRTARIIADGMITERARELSSRIIITNDMAYVLFDSYGMLVGRTNAHPDILAALSGGTSEYTSEDRGLIRVALPVMYDGAAIGAVMIIHEMTDANQLLTIIGTQSMHLTLLLGGVVAIFVFLISSWLMEPLRHVLKGVHKISDGHLDERIKLEGADEFSALGVAVNDMAQKLEKVETARQEFVSNVSHELKTPLSSIKVLCESLLHQDEVENDVYREFLQDITSEVDRMADIINELLNLVRLDETELPLNISNFNLNKLVADTIKRLKPLAAEKDISVDLAEVRQVNMDGDEMKLTLAISNLIENAIKYNNPGGFVKIIIDADNKSAFLTVSDNGVGIAEEDQTKIFSRFFRVDKARDGQSGTGLGLSITQKIILLHKGSIRLNSQENEGATFLVRIPLR